MKRIFLTSVAGILTSLSSTVQASPSQEVARFTSYLMSKGFSPSAYLNNGTAPEPIRYAKLRAKIYQDTFVKNGDKFDFKTVQICEQTKMVPVYDLRTGGATKLTPTFSCKASNIPGDIREVRLYSTVNLSREELWENEGESDYKIMSNYMFVSPVSNGDPSASGAHIATRDISLQSAILVVRPEVIVSCPTNDTCAPNVNQFFWAFTEIEDNQ